MSKGIYSFLQFFFILRINISGCFVKYRIISLLLEKSPAPQSSPYSSDRKLSEDDHKNLELVNSYISDHFTFHLPIEQLSKMACMSQSKLRYCFKSTYGCTITEFIQNKRMAQAEYMLLETTLQTNQIAKAIGYALMTVLKGVAEIEMLCLNSRESFEDNKRFLRTRMEQEDNLVVCRLLKKDQTHLDRIQVQMATAHEFLIIVRLREEKKSDVHSYLSHIERSLKEQGFSVKGADSEDIKRILAVYYEQNVTTERFEDFDGERWIIPED